jgi:hypothetical protein
MEEDNPDPSGSAAGASAEAIPKSGEQDAIFGIQVARYTQFHIMSYFGTLAMYRQVVNFQ